MVLSRMESAERFAARRARIARLIGALFLFSLAGSFHENDLSHPTSLSALIWMTWAVFLLGFVIWGSGLFRSESERALIDDETTAAHRAAAMVTGFWGALVLSVVLIGLTFLWPIPTAEALRGIVSAAVGLTLIRFGRLEQQALADA